MPKSFRAGKLLATDSTERTGDSMSAPTRAQQLTDVLPRSPRAMAKAGGLHPFGVLVLLAGAFLPIADFFIVNVALPTIDKLLDTPRRILA
jgi:hypothetical protein